MAGNKAVPVTPAMLGIKQLRQIAYNYEGEEQLKKLDSAYTAIAAMPNDSTARALMLKLAQCYGSCMHIDQYIPAATKAFKMASRANDSVVMAKSMHEKGIGFEMISHSDSSLYCYMKAGQLYNNLDNRYAFGLMQHYTARVLFNNGGYKEAEAYMISSIKELEEVASTRDVFECYWDLAVFLHKLQNYDAALYYQHKMLEQLEHPEVLYYTEGELKNAFAATYCNIGESYLLKKEYHKTILYSDKALTYKNPDLNFRALVLSNRAEAKMSIDPNWDWEDVKKDIDLSAEGIDPMTGDQVAIIQKKTAAVCYLLKKDTLTAVKLFNESLRNARLLHNSSEMMDILPKMALADKKRAQIHLKNYLRLSDSIIGAERSFREKFSRIAYETESLKKQNSHLHRNSNYSLLICLLIVGLGLTLYVIHILKSRNKLLQYQQQQEVVNEQVYSLLAQKGEKAEQSKTDEREKITSVLQNGLVRRIAGIESGITQLTTEDERRRKLLANELKEAQEDINKLSLDLKYSFINDDNFVVAIKQLVEKQRTDNATDFILQIDCDIKWTEVTPESRVAIFRIIQEACTNIKKYADAQTCEIKLVGNDTGVRLTIIDNGRGFDTQKKKNGIGIRNMSERITELGGIFNLKSAPGDGTVLEVVI